MTSRTRKIREIVSAWPGISVHPHRFAGEQFNVGNAEVGHVHAWGMVDIPFPRAIRNTLIENQLAEQHHWMPNSGWATFHLRKEGDMDHALWLLRISWLRYALKTVTDPRAFLIAEAERLHFSPELLSLMAPFVPGAARAATEAAVAAR